MEFHKKQLCSFVIKAACNHKRNCNIKVKEGFPAKLLELKFHVIPNQCCNSPQKSVMIVLFPEDIKKKCSDGQETISNPSK